MPLGIGKYSQHNKLSTNSVDDDDIDEYTAAEHKVSSNTYTLTYLGEQNVPIFLSTDVSAMIHKVYSDNYSSLAKLIHLKKFNLVIDAHGISVVQPANRKQSASLILKYKILDLIMVTMHEEHEKLLSIVLKSSPSKAVVHVYLCDSSDEPKSFIEDCLEEFHQQKYIKEIKSNSFPYSIEFKRKQIRERLEESSDDKVISKSDNHESYATSNATKKITKDSMVLQNSASNSINNEVRNDSLEDEFSQLALKRNKNQPDHMQDKSVESSMLIQQNDSLNADEDDLIKMSKQSFFSQYNRL